MSSTAEDIINDLHRSPALSVQEVFSLLTQMQNLNQPIQDEALKRFILYDEQLRARFHSLTRIGQDIDILKDRDKENEIMVSDPP